MSRVSFYTRPYDRLEPYDGKLSRTVLRGGAGSNASLLPDIRNEKDVLTLIDNLIKNTTPRNASSNDPFWEKAEIALDSALMLYLVSEAPPEEQNFETMIYMMNFAEVREEDDQYRSPLDMLFRALEEEQPNHVAVKQFKAFKQAAEIGRAHV